MTRRLHRRLNPLELEAVRQFRALVRTDSYDPRWAVLVLRGLESEYRRQSPPVPFDHAAVMAALYPDWVWGRVKVVLA